MTLSVRRFAPNTVRQPRNAVRHGLEQVSDSVGMRTHEACPAVAHGEGGRYIAPGYWLRNGRGMKSRLTRAARLVKPNALC